MKLLFAPILSGLVLLAGAAPLAAAPVTVLVNAQDPGIPIAANFTGLSFDAAQLLPNATGVHYFRPDNEPLVRLFHTLGIRSLRIGGNSSDRDARQLPANADLDSLFAFARAADVKIIYCLRLRGGSPEAATETVKYIMSRYGEQMDCFSIGQEPSDYPAKVGANPSAAGRMEADEGKYSYPAYADEWRKFENNITATVPGVKLCGPSVQNNPAWARRFITDFSHGHNVALVTEHLYPGGDGGQVPAPETGLDRLLSTNIAQPCEKLYASVVPLATSNGLPCRLEEVNTFFNGGVTNVSNTFASALWGLDFMYWWAAHGLAGLNFHTGDKLAAGSDWCPAHDTAFFTTTNGFNVRPLGYGIKAFAIGSHGQLLPATITNAENLNLSVYAVKDEAGHLSLTFINKEHGLGASSATISIDETHAYSGRGHLMLLAAPAQNPAATQGETLGDRPIENDGSWNGNWYLVAPSSTGTFTVEVPASTAVILKLSAN